MPRQTGTPTVYFDLALPTTAKQVGNWEQTPRPIYARMQRGERYQIATRLSCTPANWDFERKMPLTSKAKQSERRALETLEADLVSWKSLLTEIWEKNDPTKPSQRMLPPLTPERFKALVERALNARPTASQKELLEFVAEYIHRNATERQTAINAQIKRNNKVKHADAWKHPTIAAQVSVYKYLALYQKTNGKIWWEQITPQWLTLFVSWLHKPANGDVKLQIKGKQPTAKINKRALNKNSAQQAVTLLRQFLRAASLAELIPTETVNTLSLVTVKGSETNRFFASWREIEKMLQTDVSGQSDFYTLHAAKVRTMVGVLTAMRMDDWDKLKQESLFASNSGDLINIVTGKKKAEISIQLFGLLKRILEIIDWQVPRLSSSAYSIRAKELMKLAGNNRILQVKNSTGGIDHETTPTPFHEQFSSHFCRRTAAQFHAAMGTPMNQIRKVLGHKTETQTAHYMASNDLSDAANTNPEEVAAMKAFLRGEVDLSVFEANHRLFLQKKLFPRTEIWQPKRHNDKLQRGYKFWEFSEGATTTPDLKKARAKAAYLHKTGHYASVFSSVEKNGTANFSVLYLKKSAKVVENV